MELIEAIERRRSCRSFTRDPVPHRTLERLINAAKEAPSAHNEQPWHFYVAQGETRARIGEIMAQTTRYLKEYIDLYGQDFYDTAEQWYSDMGHAPVIVVCTLPASEDDITRDDRIFAMGAAAQNMLLAATDQGLGACSVSFGHWVAAELLAAVGAPEGVELAGLIVLGYPDASPAAAPTHVAEPVAEYLD